MLVGEFDIDILLLNSRKFAMEFVGFRKLLDVELRSERLEIASSTMVTAIVVGATVIVEIIEKAEEGSEGGIRVGRME